MWTKSVVSYTLYNLRRLSSAQSDRNPVTRNNEEWSIAVFSVASTSFFSRRVFYCLASLKLMGNRIYFFIHNLNRHNYKTSTSAAATCALLAWTYSIAHYAFLGMRKVMNNTAMKACCFRRVLKDLRKLLNGCVTKKNFYQRAFLFA